MISKQKYLEAKQIVEQYEKEQKYDACKTIKRHLDDEN